MTKGQNRWALQSNHWNQVWKGSNRVSGTLKEFREEGVKNLSQGGSYNILNVIHFTPQSNIHFLVGFLKEVLKQNRSYQISKHSNLCPKGCSSSFRRQIKIRWCSISSKKIDFRTIWISCFLPQGSYCLELNLVPVAYNFNLQPLIWKKPGQIFNMRC